MYDYIIEKPELNEETLAHYGVKGMKWNKRKNKANHMAEDIIKGRRQIGTSGRTSSRGIKRGVSPYKEAPNITSTLTYDGKGNKKGEYKVEETDSKDFMNSIANYTEREHNKMLNQLSKKKKK